MANELIKTTPNQTAKALETNLDKQEALLLIMVNKLENGNYACRFHLHDEVKLIKALSDSALITGYPDKILDFIKKNITLFKHAERYIEYELKRRAKTN